MKQVSREVKGFGGLVQRNSAQIKRMGRQMTMAGAAIVGGVGMMVKAYGSFNEAMVRSLAIMGDVSPAMRKEMAATAKQLSTETTFAAKELAEAYYFLASAGMSAEQSISALAPVARFAQAGAFELAQATDLLTDAQTALGLSSKDAAKNQKNLIRISDVLVGANTLANASVLQFSEALTNKAAAAMVNLNIEVEEGVAVLAAYADKGVKGRLAGQRLTMMLNGLFDATRQNKKAWDDAGISLFNADESMRDIADIIQDMEGYLGNMTVKQREATLATLGFNIKTKDSILTLMGSSEKMKEWTGKLKEMGGITKQVSDKQLKAFNAQLTLLKNVVIGAAISIGESLAPMLTKLIAKTKSVAARISAWIKEHPKLTEQIAKLAAAIGIVLTVLGPLVIMLPGIIAAWPLLASAAGVAGIAMAKGARHWTEVVLGTFKLIAQGIEGLMLAWGAFKVFVFKLGEEIVRHLARLTMGIVIVTGYTKKMGILTKTHEAAKQALKDLVTIGMGYNEAADAQIEKITDVIITFEKFFAMLDKIGKELRTSKKLVESILPPVRELADVFEDMVGKALPPVRKLTDVFEAMVGVALPAARDMSGVLENVVTKMKTNTDEGTEEIVETWEDSFWKILSAATLFTSSLGSLFDQLTTNQMANIDKEYEARRLAIENSLMTEKSKADAMEKLDADIDKKRKKAERASAKRTKAVSIMEAIVGTAAAVVQAMKAPFPLSLILPVIIGAMGAAQIALIAATPLPALAKGGRLGKGEPGIVGEEGKELFVPDTTGTVVPLREGARGGALGGSITILTEVYMQTIDGITTREFMRREGLQAIVEAIKVGIMKPELQEALRIK